MRILRRFVSGGHHFAPGDEAYLVKVAAKVGIIVEGPDISDATDDFDPALQPWTDEELAKLHAAEERASKSPPAADVPVRSGKQEQNRKDEATKAPEIPAKSEK